MVRTEEEIHEQIDKALDRIDFEGRFQGMTYEEGVAYALKWVIGEIDEAPMQEEEF
jgi:hypothetical protein